MTRPIPVEPSDPLSDPTNIALTADTSVPAGSKYILRVTPDAAGHELIVPSAKSHLVQNEGSFPLTLVTVVSGGSASVEVPAGGEGRATWSGAGGNHEVQVTANSGGTGGTVDAAMSATSTNAVQNQAIKAYVDSAIATISGSNAVPYTLTANGHGLTVNDVGKPLSRATGANAPTVWNDTSALDPLYILGAVTDANTITVHTYGARVADIPTTLTETFYSFLTDGPFLWWDNSVGKYVKNRPADTHESIGPQLQVVSTSAQTFVAVVRT